MDLFDNVFPDKLGSIRLRKTTLLQGVLGTKKMDGLGGGVGRGVQDVFF